MQDLTLVSNDGWKRGRESAWFTLKVQDPEDLRFEYCPYLFVSSVSRVETPFPIHLSL